MVCSRSQDRQADWSGEHDRSVHCAFRWTAGVFHCAGCRNRLAQKSQRKDGEAPTEQRT